MRTISSNSRSDDIARGAAIIAALYLTGGLLWLLPSSGYTPVRLLLFLLILVCGWIGTLGVLRRRISLIVIGAIGLLLLGFWQAVLWVFMIPTAVILLITVFALNNPSNDQ